MWIRPNTPEGDEVEKSCSDPDLAFMRCDVNHSAEQKDFPTFCRYFTRNSFFVHKGCDLRIAWSECTMCQQKSASKSHHKILTLV